MGKVNKKAAVITGIIFIAVLFSNIIYAENSGTDTVYTKKVSVVGRDGIVTNGDKVQITIRSEEEFSVKEKHVYIDGKEISNLEPEDYYEDGRYIMTYEIPDEIKTDDETVFTDDNKVLGFAITVADSKGNEKIIRSEEKDELGFYKRLDDSTVIISVVSQKENLKEDDSFSVSIEAGHPINISDIGLKGLDGEFEHNLEHDEDKQKWKVDFHALKGGSNKHYSKDIVDIIYKMTVGDGLSELKIANEAGLKYYRQMKIKITQMDVGGTVNKKFVKLGDEINVAFEVSRPVQSIKGLDGKEIKIDGGTGSISAGNKHTATYTVGAGYGHGENISLSLKIEDFVGCEKTVEIVNGVQYLKPLSEESVKGFKFDKPVVKDGDRLTALFDTDRPVIVENIKLIMDSEGQEDSGEYIKGTAGSESTDGCKLSLGFRIKDKKSFKDDAKLVCIFTIIDAAGNSYTAKKDCSTYYKSIDIGIPRVYSSNRENTHLVKNGEKIFISFKSTHPVNALCSITEKSNAGNMQLVSGGREGNKYKYVYGFDVKDGRFDDNGEIKFKMIVRDAAENAEVAIDDISDVIYYAPIDESFRSLQCNSSNDSVNYVMDRDTVTLIYKTGHPVNIESMSIAGKKVECIGTDDNKSWKGTLKLGGLNLEDDSIIKYKFKVTDEAGNKPRTYSHKNRQTVRYFAPIEINGLKMVKGGKDKKPAKAGDRIIISFNTTHKIDIKKLQIKMSGNHNTDIVKYGEKRGSRYYYESSFVVPEDGGFDNKRIGMSLRAGDAAGNRAVSKDEGDVADTILYYMPLRMSVSGNTFSSSNGNGKVAKDGDALTLSFKSSHPVKVNGRIAGMPVKFISSDGGYSWAGSAIIKAGTLTDNSDISYSMNISDSAGNDKYSLNQDNTAKIAYYAPLAVHGLSMESDNESGNPLIAKNNDNITVRFRSEHPVQISESVIGRQEVDFTSEDNMDWTAVYKVREGDTDNMSAIPMKFTVNDTAGNQGITVTQVGVNGIVYYAPIHVGNLKITTNNIKDGTKYAKDGDTVTVEFDANHQVGITDGMIAGHQAGITTLKVSDTEYKCKMEYTVNNGDLRDLSEVGFGFSLSDEASNDRVDISRDSGIVQNAITYYAPFTAETEYSSDYKEGTYAKNGDMVTVRCRSSHLVSVVNASIAGRQAEVQGNDTDTITMAYKIPENEGAIPEGAIPFEYTIEDKAGNELKADKVSESAAIKGIIYDRTLPVVKVVKDNTQGGLFSSDTVNYSIEYTGTNIFEGGMSCIINGEESIGSLKKYPVEDGYRIDIELDEEDNYIIKPSCTDMAGNRDLSDASIAVTIDKTSPKLRTVDINTGHIFNSEFALADFMDIDEKNLKDMDCMLTDSEGSHDWDFNSKITGDGKKTITLKMTDMAGNTSDTYVYEFYVDVTGPSPVIMDKESGYLLQQGKNAKRFAKNASFSIALDDINVGREPDRFTSIKVLDKDGNEYMDVMESGTHEGDGSYSISIATDGEYTLCAQAVDSAGNETGALKYSFIIGEEPWYKNTPIFAVAACVSLLAMGAAAGMFIKKKGK